MNLVYVLINTERKFVYRGSKGRLFFENILMDYGTSRENGLKLIELDVFAFHSTYNTLCPITTCAMHFIKHPKFSYNQRIFVQIPHLFANGSRVRG